VNPKTKFSKRKSKIKTANILKGRGRAYPAVSAGPKGPEKPIGGTQKERPPALPHAAQV
jgi:hypothetical protein